MKLVQRAEELLKSIPPDIKIVAAAKTRTPEEILDVISAGIVDIGENYIQEASKAFEVVQHKAVWHFIGHLQKNKVKKAVEISDMIQTVDSEKLALEINKRAANLNKVMPILIEINSGHEEQKAGILPEETINLIEKISGLSNIRIHGLMTMGPVLENPGGLRPYFKLTRRLFEKLNSINLPNVEMKFLSMGMSDSYEIAITEGSNMIRLGTILFGARKYY